MNGDLSLSIMFEEVGEEGDGGVSAAFSVCASADSAICDFKLCLIMNLARNLSTKKLTRGALCCLMGFCLSNFYGWESR